MSINSETSVQTSELLLPARLPARLPNRLVFVWERWKHHYQQNSRTILSLTVVNVLLTVLNEFAGRTLYTGLHWASSREAFIVWDSMGEWTIHRQSMVNILMTLFLSLAGGPIHFLKSAKHRFLFFGAMAVVVSVLSQFSIWLLIASTAVISLKRVTFDLLYSSAVKYPAFEIVRPWVLKHRKSFFLLLVLRYSQDFTLSMVRIGLLILFGIDR